VFHHHLFVVRVSVQASMVPGPTAPGETEKAASTLEGPTAPGETEKAASTPEALASVLVDLSEPVLERLQTAKR
jgi:hypothetical protein